MKFRADTFCCAEIGRTIAMMSLSLMVLFALGGCMFRDLKQELIAFDQTYGLSGRVEGSLASTVPVTAVLYRINDAADISVEQFMLVDETGAFSFLVPAGDYIVTVFADNNWDQRYTDGEWFAVSGVPDPVRVDPVSLEGTGRRAIRLPDMKMTSRSGYPGGLPRDADQGEPSESWVKLGALGTLDDPMFTHDNGVLGFWKPLSFLKQIGFGIYFLERFDSNKIPLILVHGANGTPLGWRSVIDRLDRDRFQPWLYYYPTGLRIDTSAHVLSSLIQELSLIHNFSRVHVMAQSMGGLVSRACIVELMEKQESVYVDTFITVSTPWGGVNTAALGIKQAPAAIPSWFDIAPESDFLTRLYEKPLPEKTRFFLIFGVRGESSLLMGNNDGTVEIASELYLRAQHEAERIFGFDEDHGSIIESEQVLALIENLLKRPDTPW